MLMSSSRYRAVSSSHLDFVVALRWHEHRPVRLGCASLCLRKGLLPRDTQVHDSLSPAQHYIGVKTIGAKSENVPVMFMPEGKYGRLGILPMLA